VLGLDVNPNLFHSGCIPGGEVAVAMQRIAARMRGVKRLRIAIFALPLLISGAVRAQEWTVQATGRSSLRGVSAVHASATSRAPVVWASGSGATVLRSEDGGATWTQLSVLGADGLDFRGIWAIDGKIAYIMSIGPGDKSRIYKTTDAGVTWQQQYSDTRQAFFLDAIACVSETRCFVAGDPIDGKIFFAGTEDGKTWHEMSHDSMPAALQGEGAFAASNTALTISDDKTIYICTGGAATARVLRSADFGRTWSVSTPPLAAASASMGAFSVLGSGKMVYVVGGDYRAVATTTGVAAFSIDGGATWQLATQQPGGFRSAVAKLDDTTLVAVGPNGEDISRDRGVTWIHSGTVNLNAVSVLDGVAWGVGARGTIARFSGQSSK
jgi:photosystem II stability/assembly factor-like uncharacterized protein